MRFRAGPLTLFSSGRPGGAHDHPELKVPHQRVAERARGLRVPALGDGPKVLTAVAYDAAGASVRRTVNVTARSVP